MRKSKLVKGLEKIIKVGSTGIALLIAFGTISFAVSTLLSGVLPKMPQAPLPNTSDSYGAELMRQWRGSIAKIYSKRLGGETGGTGFVVEAESGKKYILTNRHVCDLDLHYREILVKFNDATRPMPTHVIEKYTETDLCIMELPGVDRPAIPIGDSPSLGELVVTVGHPLLRPLTPSTGAVTDVSAPAEVSVDKSAEECVGPRFEFKRIETSFGPQEICIETYIAHYISAQTQPGNSGSPAFNASGEIMGIVFAGANDGWLGIIIGSDRIKEFLKDR